MNSKTLLVLVNLDYLEKEASRLLLKVQDRLVEIEDYNSASWAVQEPLE